MEDLDFSKILQDAEALSCEIEGNTDMPRVQRNLRQVLEAGQLLVSRNTHTRDEPGSSVETKASVFFGTRGVDITRMTENLEPYFNIVTSRGPAGTAVGSDADLDGFLRGERTNIIYNSVESASKSLFSRLRENIRTELKTAWGKEKELILNTLNTTANGTMITAETDSNFGFGMDNRHPNLDAPMETSSILSSTELTYSNEIDSYVKTLVTNQPKPNLLEKFEIIAQNMNDKNVQELWESVSAMLTPSGSNPTPVIERRSSSKMKKSFILRAKQYLEKCYFARIQSDVWKNLGGGRLGGIPSVTSIIKNFVALKNMESIPGLEVGPAGCGPVWVLTYLFIRSGNIQSAINYMRNEVGNQEFAKVLNDYVKFEGNTGGLGLPKELEAQIRLEYMRVMRTTTTDPFKKLLYCYLGACDLKNDHTEIVNRLDDYLWLKLSQIRELPPPTEKFQADFLSYSGFQEMILEKYGETYFDAYKQPFTYFQALLLTGQFEAAVEFLYRIGTLRPHAVHVAVVMFEGGLMVTSDFNSLPLTRIKTDPAGIRRLNYAHLIAQYARTFQGSNTREGLNYLYLLKNLKDQSGTNLFSICVSNMAIESKSFQLLFGGISTDGCRTPGLLETMGINMRPILDHCAAESETSGMLEDAVLLYDLGGQAEAALTVLNRLVARHASRTSDQDPARNRIQAIALTLADRYSSQELDFVNRLIPTTFFLLVDLMTFFDEFQGRRSENALAIIQRIRILPFRREEIERCVNNFHSYSDEVRMNVPDLIIATMECLHGRYKKLKQEHGVVVSVNNGQGDTGEESQTILEEVKGRAKTLVTYCGLIPYFMTGDVYSKVMQIEVQIN